MTFPFLRLNDGGLIIVHVVIDTRFKLTMVLDTGATHTTIDSNALYLLGYNLKNTIGKVEIETANGVIETEVFEVTSFSSLGIVKTNFQMQVYDFLTHGIFTDYNGVLGLDFLEGKTFCVDTIKNLITIS